MMNAMDFNYERITPLYHAMTQSRVTSDEAVTVT
jgi:hypothetical protein